MVKARSLTHRGLRHNTVRQPVSKIHFGESVSPGRPELKEATSCFWSEEDRIDKLLSQLEAKSFEIFQLKESAKWAAQQRDEDKKHSAQMFDELSRSQEREHKLQQHNDVLIEELTKINEHVKDQVREIFELRKENNALQAKLAEYEEIFEDMPVSPKDILRIKSQKPTKKDDRVRSMITPFDGKKKNNKSWYD